MTTHVQPTTLHTPFDGSGQVCSPDPAVLSSYMGHRSVDHVVEPLSGTLSGLVTGHQLGEVALAYVRYGNEASVTARPTRDRICWTMPMAGMKVTIGSRDFDWTAGFTLDQKRSTTMRPHPTSGAVVVTTSQERLTSHLGRLLQRHSLPEVRFDTGPAPQTRGLVDLAWRQAVCAINAAPQSPGLAAAMEENLLTAMLLELPGNGAEMLTRDQTAIVGADAHVKRAVSWAMDQLAEPIQLTEWASAVGISPRHLQKSFREVYGCSPMSFVQNARLERAHSWLRRPSPGDSVTSIALASGFSHMGRFAAHYRRRYGEHPSTTLNATNRSGGTSLDQP